MSHVRNANLNTFPAVAIENLSFSYAGQLVLEDINYQLAEGEFLLISGANGGGKTTLIKLILGILQPSLGKISVFGQAPTKLVEPMGYVPQMTQVNQSLPIRVADVVACGLYGCCFSRKERQTQIADALARVGVEDLKDKRFTALSGGQRQKVLIARAIASNPRLLILDEPTASLDKASKQNVRELLSELHAHTTLILISHEALKEGMLPITQHIDIARTLRSVNAQTRWSMQPLPRQASAFSAGSMRA